MGVIEGQAEWEQGEWVGSRQVGVGLRWPYSDNAGFSKINILGRNRASQRDLRECNLLY